jgi:hypothetical protein
MPTSLWKIIKTVKTYNRLVDEFFLIDPFILCIAKKEEVAKVHTHIIILCFKTRTKIQEHKGLVGLQELSQISKYFFNTNWHEVIFHLISLLTNIFHH